MNHVILYFLYTKRKRLYANIFSLSNRKPRVFCFFSVMPDLWLLFSKPGTSHLLAPFCPSKCNSGPRVELLTMDGFGHLSLLPDQHLPPLPAFSVKFLLLGVFLLELDDSLLQPPQGVVRKDQGSRKVRRHLPKDHILYLQTQNKAMRNQNQTKVRRKEGKAVGSLSSLVPCLKPLLLGLLSFSPLVAVTNQVNRKLPSENKPHWVSLGTAKLLGRSRLISTS